MQCAHVNVPKTNKQTKKQLFLSLLSAKIGEKKKKKERKKEKSLSLKL